jgi:hypothetical protein
MLKVRTLNDASQKSAWRKLAFASGKIRKYCPRRVHASAGEADEITNSGRLDRLWNQSGQSFATDAFGDSDFGILSARQAGTRERRAGRREFFKALLVGLCLIQI